ncbi:MAG: type II toxin-antitoxin system VapC family toxin [Methanobacterium sp.]|nr:type II toxin-antitoxin system VapC family toxin [Methanobacterium sp.]
MKLVLDANVFNSKNFCNWLLNSEFEKYLPSIAYMEYLYHHLKKGNTESMVNAFLEQMNISVVPFGKQDAFEVANASIGRWDFSENAHDYAIGATAIILRAKLVTNNIKHFQWMDDVLTPEEVMDNFKKRP